MIEHKISKIAKYNVSNSNDSFTIVISKIEARFGDNSSCIFLGTAYGFLMTKSSPNFIFKEESFFEEIQEIVYDKCISYLESITTHLRIKEVSSDQGL